MCMFHIYVYVSHICVRASNSELKRQLESAAQNIHDKDQTIRALKQEQQQQQQQKQEKEHERSDHPLPEPPLATHRNTLQHTATHCTTLRDDVQMHDSNILESVAIPLSTIMRTDDIERQRQTLTPSLLAHNQSQHPPHFDACAHAHLASPPSPTSSPSAASLTSYHRYLTPISMTDSLSQTGSLEFTVLAPLAPSPDTGDGNMKSPMPGANVTSPTQNTHTQHPHPHPHPHHTHHTGLSPSLLPLARSPYPLLYHDETRISTRTHAQTLSLSHKHSDQPAQLSFAQEYRQRSIRALHNAQALSPASHFE